MSFTVMHLFFDDIAVGQEWTSVGRTLTETDIVNFAGLSGDFNAIHVDHAFAATTPFRKPIAHGLLVLSIGSGLLLHAPPVRTLALVGLKDWQFKLPVYAGDTLRAFTRVHEKQERARGRRGLVTWHRVILNQKDQAVQEGFTVTLVEGRANLKRGGDAAGGERTAR